MRLGVVVDLSGVSEGDRNPGLVCETRRHACVRLPALLGWSVPKTVGVHASGGKSNAGE